MKTLLQKTNPPYLVADINLADWGYRAIEMAEREMPCLLALQEKYGKKKPLKGLRIMGSLYMTIQTAVLIKTLEVNVINSAPYVSVNFLFKSSAFSEMVIF